MGLGLGRTGAHASRRGKNAAHITNHGSRSIRQKAKQERRRKRQRVALNLVLAAALAAVDMRPRLRKGSDDPTAPDRTPQASQGVNRLVFCQGCDQPFTPVRATQQHCKPSRRVLACRRRAA